MTRENLSRQENKSRVWIHFSCFITKGIINRVSRADSPEIFASVETPLKGNCVPFDVYTEQKISIDFIQMFPLQSLFRKEHEHVKLS